MKLFSNYEEFLGDLEEAGFKNQVYDGRTAKSGVEVPYIVCVNEYPDDTFADNKHYKRKDVIEVMLHSYSDPRNELITQKKEAEEKLQAYFDTNKLAYRRVNTSWVEDVELWITQYEVEIVYV